MKDNYFKTLYKIFLDTIPQPLGGKSLTAFTNYLGLSRGKVDAWKAGQRPKAEDLRLLHDKLGLSYRWLVTGEGDPFEELTGTVTVVMKREKPFPLLGFTGCGIDGWGGTVPYAVTVAPPEIHDGMLAVMASGDSMVPEGIGNGQICFCDPQKEPGIGDAVYIKRTDGLGAIKKFLGTGIVGLYVPEDGKIALQGWLSQNGGTQKPFFIDVDKDSILTLAPVIYVQRRM